MGNGQAGTKRRNTEKKESATIVFILIILGLPSPFATIAWLALIIWLTTRTSNKHAPPWRDLEVSHEGEQSNDDELQNVNMLQKWGREAEANKWSQF